MTPGLSRIAPPRIAALLAAVALAALAGGRALEADSGIDEEIRGDLGKSDLEMLQGQWVLAEFAHFDANGVDTMQGQGPVSGQLSVKGLTYHLKLTLPTQQVDDDYTFRLYPRVRPRAFEVRLPDGRTILGIYETDGKTLRRCYSQPGQPRPTSFRGPAYTYQRWTRRQEG